jgi:hypothetical protein
MTFIHFYIYSIKTYNLWIKFMALIECKECSKQVSNSAEVCPHCGFRLKKATTVKPQTSNTAMGCLWLVILLGVFAIIRSCTDDAPKGPTAEEEAATPACQADLSCLKRTIQSGAVVDCANAIERQAKWDYQWPDGSGYSAFPSFIWANAAHSQVALSGSSLKLQNGFGAWQHVTYICYVDVPTRRVVNVEIIN